jgi:hypothetical protein
MEREIIRVVRTLTWLELDDLTDSISTSMPALGCFDNAQPTTCFELKSKTLAK